MSFKSGFESRERDDRKETRKNYTTQYNTYAYTQTTIGVPMTLQWGVHVVGRGGPGVGSPPVGSRSKAPVWVWETKSPRRTGAKCEISVQFF